uniref:Carboxymuconolactone decarboxylase-like domain-containing protein n=1 Tax=Desulfovibrio sp. U5L TaxID=596152 RepID=I2Q467_9BACT
MATLPMPDPDNLPPDAHALYDRLAAKRGHIDGMYRTLLNHPALTAQVSGLGTFFRFGESVLPADLRELVILWTARRLGAAYEWTKHEPEARQTGLGEAAIEAIRRGERPGTLSRLEKAALAAADAALAPASLDPAHQTILEEALGRQGLLEIVVLAGFYRMIAGVIFAFDVPLPEGTPPPF